MFFQRPARLLKTHPPGSFGFAPGLGFRCVFIFARFARQMCCTSVMIWIQMDFCLFFLW